MKLVWEELSLKPDPVHGTPLPRSSHGLSVIQQGKALLLYGGEHVARTPVEPTQAIWKADLVQQCWKAIVFTGGDNHENNCPVPSPRIAHAQAVYETSNNVDNNTTTTTKLFVLGGRSGVDMHETALPDLWCFDVESETWTEIKATNEGPEARSFHRMVCVGDSLYVFGGCGKHGRLADLHRFDIPTQTWEALPVSSLRGRGGPNFVALDEQKLLVLAGFAGEETRDAQVFDLTTKSWEEPILTCHDLRPRSVCVAAPLEGKNRVVLFGGEVNPSDRGHEGAGGFAKDVVLVTASVVPDASKTTTTSLQFLQEDSMTHSEDVAPSARGWSAGDSYGGNTLYMFGGLAGDDAHPERLGDLWKLTILED